MSQKLNWEKAKKQTKQYLGIQKLQDDLLHKKLALAKILLEKGWVSCSRCGGDCHPAFLICRNCKNNTLTKQTKLHKFCKRCHDRIKGTYDYCYHCTMKTKLIRIQSMN